MAKKKMKLKKKAGMKLLEMEVVEEHADEALLEGKTLKELNEHKLTLRKKMFGADKRSARGKLLLKAKGGDLSIGLQAPCYSLSACLNSLRGSFVFRTCIAREADTPLTELHLLQPLMAVMVVISVVLFTTDLICRVVGSPLPGLMYPTFSAQFVSTFALSYVALLSFHTPSQEELNVTLSEEVNTIGEHADQHEVDAVDAERLNCMTLNWLQDRTSDRNHVDKLRCQLKEDQEKFWAFTFKNNLLKYLSRGEWEVYQEKDRALLDSGDLTMKEYKQKRAELLPDGMLTCEELEAVMAIIRDIEHNTMYDFVDDVLRDVLESQLKPENQAYLIEAGEAAEELSWSYGDVVDRVYNIAKSDKYQDNLRKALKVSEGAMEAHLKTEEAEGTKHSPPRTSEPHSGSLQDAAKPSVSTSDGL